MDLKRICKYAPCSCDAALPGLDYCCDYCREADAAMATGSAIDPHCHCMHADCGAEPEIPSVTESLFLASAALADA